MLLWAKEALLPAIQLIVFRGPFLLFVVADLIFQLYIFTSGFLRLSVFSAILEPLVRYKERNAIKKNRF